MMGTNQEAWFSMHLGEFSGNWQCLDMSGVFHGASLSLFNPTAPVGVTLP